MATPAVREIRNLFPKSRITLLAHSRLEKFWSGIPGMDRVLVSPTGGFRDIWKQAAALRAEGFDAALTFPSSLSSAFLLFAAQIPVRLGWSAEGRDWFLTQALDHEMDRKIHLVWDYLDLVHRAFQRKSSAQYFLLESGKDTSAEKEAVRLLGKTGAKGIIALGPGATYGPAKRWPLENWKALLRLLLARRKETLVVLGTREEKASFEPIREGLGKVEGKRVLILAGETEVPVLSALLSRSRLLVTNDSGPMHLAAANRTPVVAIFGSTSPLWTSPFGEGHSVIYKSLECSPCFQKTCPIGYPCLREITLGEVYAEIQKRLSAKEKVTGLGVPKGLGR